jgi:hypothetical protein
MKKHLISTLILITFCSCSSHGIFGKSSKSSGGPKFKSTNAHATANYSMNAYQDSITAAMNVNQYALCRDLTDEEAENAGKSSDSGYHDSQETDESADQYAEVENLEIDDGKSVIIDEEKVKVIS